MTTNYSRSLNTDLQNGIHDGCCKQLSPDRGGVVETNDLMERYASLQPQYGITDMDRGLTGKDMLGVNAYGT